MIRCRISIPPTTPTHEEMLVFDQPEPAGSCSMQLFSIWGTFWDEWSPDWLLGGKITIAEASSPAGHIVRIVQWWNNQDFYSVQLVHHFPDRRTTTTLLDADSSKLWRANVSIDEIKQIVSVQLSPTKIKMVRW